MDLTWTRRFQVAPEETNSESNKIPLVVMAIDRFRVAIIYDHQYKNLGHKTRHIVLSVMLNR